MSVAKRIAPGAGEPHINDCCVGGDVVLERLLPSLRERYGDELVPVQEDGSGSSGSTTTV